MSGAGADAAYRASLDQAARFIRERDDFLVVSHIDPDGDATSSTCAMGWILEQCGKRYVMINEGDIPGKFGFLHGCDRIVNMRERRPDRTFRHIISVDCADFERFGSVAELFAEEYELLNIDHHPTNDLFGAVNCVQPEAAAAAEMLFDLMQAMKLELSRNAAECVYTGLMTDTGGFRYSNTTPKVMRTASELLSYGVEGARLAGDLLEKVTFAHVELLKRALATLSFTSDRRIAWMVVSRADMDASGASNHDMDGLVNYPRNIEGVDIGILFKETREGEFKISLRSGERADVSAVARRFGGGGHVRASGATLSGRAADVVKQVVAAAEAALS